MDHPHACGDKVYISSAISCFQGSSPRVWGQGTSTPTGIHLIRIIPTRVGTRKRCYLGNGKIKDHPHACGDKSYPTSRYLPKTGSSPRVWGQGLYSLLVILLVGIIPTRVGTSLRNILYQKYWVGSSPRVWGQGQSKFYCAQYSRIIPTRVGTRMFYLSSAVVIKDHPHACGDKSAPLPALISLDGSSPRVWGQVIVTSHSLLNPGIIPTRVGTRIVSVFFVRQQRDHPHACGDKCTVTSGVTTKAGSSPRVWGQGHYGFSGTSERRIIPTRVGTSLSAFRALFHLQDHPHACGDKRHR